MSLVAIYENNDGTISVVYPIDSELPLNEIFDKACGDKEYIVIEKQSLPQDRIFRDAWKLVGDAVEIDRDKAEELHMNRLRYLRKKSLEKLDVEYFKALSVNDNIRIEDINNIKQNLRNMPDTYDLTELPLEELHLAKPDYLEGDVVQLSNCTIKKEKL